MPLLFSVSSIPELAHVPAEEHTRLWRAAITRARVGWLATAASLIFMMMVNLISRNVVGTDWRNGVSWLKFLAVCAAAGLVYGTVLVNVLYRRVRAQLRSGLRAEGRCEACGYDVRASPDRCPECGEAVTARGSTSP